MFITIILIAAALPQQRSHAHHTELILWQTHGGKRGMHVRGNHFLIIEPNHGDIIRHTFT